MSLSEIQAALPADLPADANLDLATRIDALEQRVNDSTKQLWQRTGTQLLWDWVRDNKSRSDLGFENLDARTTEIRVAIVVYLQTKGYLKT